MEYPVITSRKNRLVQEAAALISRGEQRREKGLFLCEGARLCQDAALSGIEVEICFFTAKALERYGGYLKPILSVCKQAFTVEEHVAELLSSTKSPQGIFCVCRSPLTLSGDFQSQGSCVVLENLQDPGNLGTVLRTAEALGISWAVLLGACCDPLSPKVLRASMGAVFRLGLWEERSPQKLQELLESRGYVLHAAVPDPSAKRVTEVDFSQGLHAVCIGNEGNGLSPETIALCGDRVAIPMEGRAESLNASAAATILMWEMKRASSLRGISGKGGQKGETHG